MFGVGKAPETGGFLQSGQSSNVGLPGLVHRTGQRICRVESPMFTFLEHHRT